MEVAAEGTLEVAAIYIIHVHGMVYPFHMVHDCILYTLVTAQMAFIGYAKMWPLKLVMYRPVLYVYRQI